MSEGWRSPHRASTKGGMHFDNESFYHWGMMTTMRQLALLLAAVLLLVSAPAQADQTDPALDDLFEKLQGLDAGVRAPNLTAEIWQRWLEAGNARVNERVQVGVIAMNAGYFKVAEDTFTEVIEKAPDFAEGWNKRATVRYFMGNHTGSIADCARVLELEPRHFGALSGLGMIHVALEDDKEAVRWFERALEIHPHLPGLKENVSILRERLRGKAI